MQENEETLPLTTRGNVVRKVLETISGGGRRRSDIAWKLVAILSATMLALTTMLNRSSTDDRALLRDLVQRTISLQEQAQKSNERLSEQAITAIVENKAQMQKLTETVREMAHVYEGASSPRVGRRRGLE